MSLGCWFCLLLCLEVGLLGLLGSVVPCLRLLFDVVVVVVVG